VSSCVTELRLPPVITATSAPARPAKQRPCLITATGARARPGRPSSSLITATSAWRPSGVADRIGFLEDGTTTRERLNAALAVVRDMPAAAFRNLLREVCEIKIYPQALAAELGVDQVVVGFN
jgi:hypothetical protein